MHLFPTFSSPSLLEREAPPNILLITRTCAPMRELVLADSLVYSEGIKGRATARNVNRAEGRVVNTPWASCGKGRQETGARGHNVGHCAPAIIPMRHAIKFRLTYIELLRIRIHITITMTDEWSCPVVMASALELNNSTYPRHKSNIIHT